MFNFYQHLPTPAIVWGSFILAGLFYFLYLRLKENSTSNLKLLATAFISKDWSTKSAFIDLALYLIGKLFDTISIGTMIGITYFLTKILENNVFVFFPMTVTSQPSLTIAVICLFFILMVNDFAGYFSHFCAHHVPILWELHKVHHSAVFLNPLTARRGHPLDSMFADFVRAVLNSIPTAVAVYFWKYSTIEVAIFATLSNKLFFLIILEPLQHSHYPINFAWLDKIIVSPHMHQVHHSSRKQHWDRNFGYIFSIWDWVFRTGYQPRPGEVIVYGVGEAETGDYQSLTGALWGPMVKMTRLVRNRSRSAARLAVGKGVLWRDPETSTAPPPASTPRL